MAYDVAGNYTRLYNWQTDRDNAIKIRADRMDGEMDGFATAFNQAFLRDGRAAMTGTLKMGAFGISGISNGTYLPATPDISFSGDATTGLYQTGVGNLSVSVTGTQIASFSVAATILKNAVQIPLDTYHGPGLTTGRYTSNVSAGPNIYVVAGGGTDLPEILLGKSQAASGILGNLAWINTHMAGASGTDKRVAAIIGSCETNDDAGSISLYTKPTGAGIALRFNVSSTGIIDVNTGVTTGGWGGNAQLAVRTVTNTTYAASFYNNTATIASGAMQLRVDNASVALADFRFSTGQVGSITTNGTTTTYGTSSDYRLKTNIDVLAGGLGYVMRLRPVVFDWANNEDVVRTQGFIAHEVQGVYDQAVHGQKDAVDENGEPVYQQLDHSKLVPMLVAAIQELKRDFDAYKLAHP